MYFFIVGYMSFGLYLFRYLCPSFFIYVFHPSYALPLCLYCYCFIYFATCSFLSLVMSLGVSFVSYFFMA